MIYHYTRRKKVESIIREGLIIPRKVDYNDYGTGEINWVLNEHRPPHLPDIINRDKCIFFHPDVQYKDSNGDITIQVNPDEIDSDKLYVADFEDAHRIWKDVVDAPYSGQRSGIPLEASAKGYWKSFRPYQEYLKEENPEKVEVLYFGDIPFQKLTVASNLHSLTQKIVSQIKDTCKIESKTSIHKNIKLKGDSIYQYVYNATGNMILLRLKEGQGNETFIKNFEKLISYKEKKVSEKYKQIRYFLI